jgi:2-methylisocitrate lyase-like PEP mutase family enzyme
VRQHTASRRFEGDVVAGLCSGFTAKQLAAAGANVLIWYCVCLRAAYHGVQTALKRLKDTTNMRKFSDILADSREFEDLLGYKHFVSRVEKYGLK